MKAPLIVITTKLLVFKRTKHDREDKCKDV